MIEKLFTLAQNKRIHELEIVASQSRALSVQAYEGKIEAFKKTNTGGIGVRGTFNGHTGYAYSERYKEDEFDFLLEMMKSNASLMDEKEPLFTKKETGFWRDLQPQPPEAQQISLALDLEKAALAQKNVSTVSNALITSGYGNSLVANSYGLSKGHESNYGMAYLSVVVKKGEDVETDSSFYVGDLYQLSIEKLANEAAEKARNKLGGKPVSTGNYPVILNHEVICSLLSTYSSIFSARNVLQGVSRLEGKRGKKIFGKLDLLDDPATGYENVYFDSEGITAEKIYLVQEGLLENYLHSLQTAAQMNMSPTGHGLRSFKGTVQIAPHRLQIPNGSYSLEQLFKEMGNGLYITDVQGLHSGTNTVSGDFSLAAQGFKIENGKIASPVNKITIAHNFFDLFADSWVKGNDFAFNMPGGHSQFGAPSILFPKMSVSS